MSCTNTLAREPGRHERDKLGIAALLMMRRKQWKKGDQARSWNLVEILEKKSQAAQGGELTLVEKKRNTKDTIR